MKYRITVYPHSQKVPKEQQIAIFENVDEEFIKEFCEFVPTIRDVYCHYEEIKGSDNTSHNNGSMVTGSSEPSTQICPRCNGTKCQYCGWSGKLHTA